ncbi:MAG: hypothetical protein JSR59_06070 [Proteobacteria bacterium]|nr:hypothetical protein [Pseudomonadota bacterium]
MSRCLLRNRASREPEARDAIGERHRLVVQRIAGRGGLLDQRGVLPGLLVERPDRLAAPGCTRLRWSVA